MYIDKTHKTWILATLLLIILATVAFAFAPSATTGCNIWSKYLLAVAGAGLLVFGSIALIGCAVKLLIRTLPKWPVVCWFATAGFVVSGLTALFFLYLRWPSLMFGMAATGLMIFAGLLPLGKKLSKWRVVSLQTMLKGHLWLGLLSMVLVLYHTRFRLGGILSTSLLIVVLVILLSGIIGLIFQYLLVIIKHIEGKGAKCDRAKTIITFGHKGSLLLHVPLAVSLFVLLALHAVMRLQY